MEPYILGHLNRARAEKPALNADVQNAERLVREADAGIARQQNIIAELDREGRSTLGAKTMLQLMDKERDKRQDELDHLRKRHASRAT